MFSLRVLYTTHQHNTALYLDIKHHGVLEANRGMFLLATHDGLRKDWAKIIKDSHGNVMPAQPARSSQVSK